MTESMKKLVVLLFFFIFAEVHSQSTDSSFYYGMKNRKIVLTRTNEPYKPNFSECNYKQQCSSFGIKINLITGKIETKKYFIYREHDKKWRLPIYWSN